MSLYPPHPMKSAGPDLTPNELELGELERSRTPSPTPSEAKALAGSKFDWSRLTDWRFYFRREWACTSILIPLDAPLTRFKGIIR